MRMKPLHLSIISVMFLAGLTTGFAQEETEIKHSTSLQIYAVYYLPDQAGYGKDGGFLPITYKVVPSEDLLHHSNDPGRDLGSSWGGAKGNAVFTHTMEIPFLRGPGPLTRGNNLAFNFIGELSPVSINIGSEVKLTPIAFLNTALGFKVGTGWNFFGLFNGLGRNLPGPAYTEPLAEPFSGAVFDVWWSATFQFDLAAVWPGEWHHIVTQLTPSIHYRGFTGAERDTAWEWEADGGQNFNSFKFIGSYVLGYQMPIALNLVAFLLETSQYIGEVSGRSIMDSGGWGSDFVEVTFGPLANVSFNEHFGLTFLIQFQTGRDYTDASIGNRYFEYREFESIYVDFYRLGFIVNIYF